MKRNIVTYNIKIQIKENDYDKLLLTLHNHQSVFNEISKWMFKHQKCNKKELHDNNYYKCRKKFKQCPSQVIIRAKDAVWANFKTLKSNKHLSKLEKAPQMSNLAMRLDKRLYTILPNNQIKLTTIHKRIIAKFKPYKKFQELLDNYTMCDPLLFFRNNQFWLNVSFEMPSPIHIENKTLGVDLGIRRFATTSEGKSYTNKIFLKKKRELRYNKRKLQSKVKTSKSSSAKRKLKKLKRKEQNRNKEFCHKISNEILNTKANTIVLENLSSLKKNKLGNKKKSKSSRNSLSQMPFYLLLSILTYKALLKGKRVATVNPAYTSQDDYRGLERGERKGCRYYACDGKVFDADWNASINIALRHCKDIQLVKLPKSFKFSYDGGLNFFGRPSSTGQSCSVMNTSHVL